MPYHDIRMPAEISRADYAVSANIGRTLDAVRQGVVDVRCCLDWRSSRAMTSSELSAPAWDRVMHSLRLRTIHVFGWAAFNHASIMLPSGVAWTVNQAHPARNRIAN